MAPYLRPQPHDVNKFSGSEEAMTLRRSIILLSILVLYTSTSFAQPFTRRSSQEQWDSLKQYYEISDFRIGGRYDLNDPAKWRNGGEGGVTLESLGGGHLRTAYISLGTPRRNAAGEITNAVIVNSYYSGDSTDMYEQWVKGTALSGGTPVINAACAIFKWSCNMQ